MIGSNETNGGELEGADLLPEGWVGRINKVLQCLGAPRAVVLLVSEDGEDVVMPGGQIVSSKNETPFVVLDPCWGASEDFIKISISGSAGYDTRFLIVRDEGIEEREISLV